MSFPSEPSRRTPGIGAFGRSWRYEGPSLYLKDMLAAIDAIDEFTEGMSLEAFQADDKTVSAVIRKLEVIGEAVKQIPDDLRTKWPGIPWKKWQECEISSSTSNFGVDHELVLESRQSTGFPRIRSEIQKMSSRIGTVWVKRRGEKVTMQEGFLATMDQSQRTPWTARY